MIGKKLNPKKFCKTLEIADTIWKKTKGLMFRKSIPKDHGILFTFNREAKHGIWMLFMRFPIDIYFLDSEMRVIDFVQGAEPINLLKMSTWRTYTPKKPAKYVLEVKTNIKMVPTGARKPRPFRGRRG